MVPRLRHGSEFRDGFAEERAAPQHELEAVLVGRIVAARDLDAAGNAVQRRFGEVEHRGGAQADPHDIDAGGEQPFNQRLLQRGRTQPAIAAHHDARRFGFRPGTGSERLPDRAGVGFAQRLPDHAANVVFAQDGGMKTVRHDPPPRRRGGRTGDVTAAPPAARAGDRVRHWLRGPLPTSRHDPDGPARSGGDEPPRCHPARLAGHAQQRARTAFGAGALAVAPQFPWPAPGKQSHGDTGQDRKPDQLDHAALSSVPA
jgi:hypothetical protein